MSPNNKITTRTRRRFIAAAVSGTASLPLLAADTPRSITQASIPGDPAAPRESQGTVPPSLPFAGPLTFRRHALTPKVQPFPLTSVRLLPGPFLDAQESNRALLNRYSADRLLHTFRVNSGLPSSAEPLGGWEKPDCELRGHFVGHFLSACALMFSSTGDAALKAKADSMVSALAECQHHLGGGFLSAFPTEEFDRLKARKKVWAPFYTYHKILAGMLDMYQYASNRQALDVAAQMAEWTGQWTAALPPDHMQMVLDEEFGGMNESLYNLAVLTSSDHFAAIGDRFTKQRFFNPLALRSDQLRGLHANTHIPQVIGASRRYELTSDRRFHDVAYNFWHQVVETRSYVTGGTSNNEGWLTEPNHLAEELSKGTATNECCCVYNMLKLTRNLFTWSADPGYFDYYERVLYNHRLGTIDTANGHTQYYLGVVPGAWRTFGTENASFWCCNGTGVEEYSKLADSIYFQNGDSLYINLFIPSELNWNSLGVRLTQTTRFPAETRTRFDIHAPSPKRFTLHVRIPSWVSDVPAVLINGKPSELSAGPGSYLVVQRTWRPGDRLELSLPMQIRVESMADNPNLQAFLYGPLVLAARVGDSVPENLVAGLQGSEFDKHAPPPVPALRSPSVHTLSNPLTFAVTGHGRELTLVPFSRIAAGQPYSIYWNVA